MSAMGDLTEQLERMEIYLRKYTRLGGDSLVVGIDFGTTYSGVAWATLSDFQSGTINLITRWPGIGAEKGKTPSQIYYEGGQVYWGYDVPGDADPVRWFKLLLLKHEDMDPKLQRSEYVLRARSMVDGLNKSAVDVISDYLKALWEHSLSCITKARSAAVVQGMQFHVVITVPAIWKSYARQAMKDAAQRAGILQDRDAGPTSLIFAPEPEAAGLATFADKGLHPLLKLTKQNEDYRREMLISSVTLVVAQCYEVDSVKPTKMREAVEGTGGLCGGIFIDQQFENNCKVRLGRRWNKIVPRDVKSFMSTQWEFGVKPQFSLSDCRSEWPVAIPASAFDNKSEKNDPKGEPALRDGTLFFKRSQVLQLFDSQISETRKLVRDQLKCARSKDRPVKGIILVGGLGCSPYLYDVLREEHEKDGISIIQADGERPWTAICRGAVFKGFLDSCTTSSGPSPVEIVSKVSRLSLGFAYNCPFDENLHPGSTKYWDEDYKAWWAQNLVGWLIKRGEDVTTKSKTQQELYRRVKPDFDGTFTVLLYQSESKDPPTTLTDTVSALCKIECRTDRKYHGLPDFMDAQGNKVENLKKLEHTLEMTPSGSSVDFAVYVDNQRQGSQTVNIEFDRGQG